MKDGRVIHKIVPERGIDKTQDARARVEGVTEAKRRRRVSRSGRREAQDWLHEVNDETKRL